MLASETEKSWNTGYISGAFDMFHIGHLNLIRKAKERCGRLVVGVLADEVINILKRKWPVVPCGHRREIVASLKYVDETDVTTPELINKLAAWDKYRFDAMFSGDDHVNDGWAHEEADLKALGADLVFFPYTRSISTTALREALLPDKSENADKPRSVEGGFRHLFPFDKVRKGERVIIYGAGDVGGQYARQIKALDFCEITAFADTYAKEGDTAEGRPCLTPFELRDNAGYDRIVIASVKYHAQITERLRSLGIHPERIV